MATKVRFFELSDADDVLRLYRSVGSWFEDVDIDRDFIVSSSERPDFRFMVAEDGGRVEGFIGALYHTAVSRAELGPLGVEESRRESGLGGALAERMLGFLREKGIRRVNVRVKASNTRAIDFFIRRGFSYEAYLRGYTARGEDVLQLVRMV
jgi:ribosomal protein S18 acetylase RimI-like enzyme